MMTTGSDPLVELVDSFVDIPGVRARFLDVMEYWSKDESFTDEELESLAFSEGALYTTIKDVMSPQYAFRECPRCSACMLLGIFELIHIRQIQRWEVAN